MHAGALVPPAADPVGFRQPPDWPAYDWAARHITRGEVVLTDGYYAVHAIAGYGPNLAAPAWPDAALDERERLRRVADVRAYLDPASTRALRDTVVRRYGVRWLLLTPDQRVPEEAVVVAWSRRTGEVLARVGVRASRWDHPGVAGPGKHSPTALNGRGGTQRRCRRLPTPPRSAALARAGPHRVDTLLRLAAARTRPRSGRPKTRRASRPT